MKLTEAEMRMVFQIESTNQNAALNEIYMTWRYAPNPATKETAEGLLDKLRPLSDQECMDLIRKVQAEYRLPEKARTIGEMLAEARQQSGAQKLSGHDMPSAELEKTVNERGISSRTMRTAKSRIGDRLVTEKDGTAWVCYLRD